MRIKIKVTKKKNYLNRVSFLLFFALTLIIYFILGFIPKAGSSSINKATIQKSFPSQDIILPPLQENIETIKRGKTLSDILETYNFSPAEIHKLREEVMPVYDLAKIKAGQQLKLFSFEDRTVVTLEYGIDSESYLWIEKNDNLYYAEIKKYPFKIKTALIWGVIEDMLIAAINQAGETDQLAINIADIFAWDIDFYADIRSGDHFKVLVEKKYLDGKFTGYGKILTAEFTNQGKTFKAFFYTYPDTKKWDYFTYNGNSLRKEFLKSPINGARITSRFSHSRLHPIRKVYRPHYGVDYGAPIGTPAQATADGTVIFAGRSGGSGRMVRIRHKNAYETMYLHLSSYGKGIRKGAKVSSGQAVGYVGSSGLSTGPHLDYRIKYHGKYVNPLAHKFKPVAPLREDFLLDFQQKADYLKLALDAPYLVFNCFSGYALSPNQSELASQ